MPSDLDLIELQARTLYRLDAAGRLLDTNEPGNAPAPRLAIGRTLAGTRWWTRHDLPADLAGQIDDLLAAEPPPRDLREPPRALDRLQSLLAAHAPVSGQWFGPAWYCPETLTFDATVSVVRLTDAAPLLPLFSDAAEVVAERQPCCAVLHDGEVVAICFSARFSAVAAEAGVETREAFRGRGYAPAVVAAWAAAVRGLGRLPLYSTSWDNLASQGVARKLGLVLYGANLSFR